MKAPRPERGTTHPKARDAVSAGETDQRLGFLGVLREMLWAFFGVRTHERYRLATQSNPLHIILAGVVVTMGLVALLVLAVKFALGWAGAA